ncbi:MAG: hypothetical protein WCT17_02085 [Bacilli bacterium]
MKKAIITFMCLLLAFVAVGCTKTPPEETTTTLDFLNYVTATVDEYLESESGNISIEMEKETSTSLEYIYNFDGSSLDELLCVLESGDSMMAAYVKDEVAYVNVNGQKNQAPLTEDEEETILDNYGLEAMTASIFATFDKSLFSAFAITSDEAGVVVLTWDSTKYVLIGEGLSDEEFIAASDRFDDITTNMTAIVVTLTYADGKVSKIESSWTNYDDVVGTIDIEFKGIGTQTITFPADLDTYTEQE